MKIKDKIKSYSFWVSLASAVILILKVIGSRFGFTVDESMVSDAFTAICSILVLLGIIVVPTTPEKTNLNESQNDLNTNKPSQFNLPENKTEDNNSNILPDKTENRNQSEIITNETQEEISNENLNYKITQTDINDNESDASNINIVSETGQTKTVYNANTTSEENQEITLINNNELSIDSEPEQNILINTNKNSEININEELNNLDETKTVKSTDIDIEENIVDELKTIFSLQREKFANNINDYILELQEEIRKSREGM